MRTCVRRRLCLATAPHRLATAPHAHGRYACTVLSDVHRCVTADTYINNPRLLYFEVRYRISSCLIKINFSRQQYINRNNSHIDEIIYLHRSPSNLIEAEYLHMYTNNEAPRSYRLIASRSSTVEAPRFVRQLAN